MYDVLMFIKTLESEGTENLNNEKMAFKVVYQRCYTMPRRNGCFNAPFFWLTVIITLWIINERENVKFYALHKYQT